MGKYACLLNNKVVNLILAPSVEVAEEATGYVCFEFFDEDKIDMGDELDSKKMAEIESKRTALQNEKIRLEKIAAEKAEAERVKALEIELERARQAEADRLAAEEAAKPKPVTGIFVKVENN